MSQQAPNEALRDLSALVGDAAAKEIVQVFLDDFPVALRSLGAGNPDEQLRAAHGLKSSARHMGADALSRRMAELEERLATTGGTVTAEDLSGARAEFEGFAAALRAYAAA